MEVNDNPFVLRDARAIRLVKLRANAENRTAANSAATTIIEALSDKYKDTKCGDARQGKTKQKIIVK